MIVAQYVAAVVIGYLLGSIPFGMLIGRRLARVDVRQYGSGKTGATNVLRTAGRKAALVVVVLDILKGVLAVTFARLIVGDAYLAVGGIAFCGLASVHRDPAADGKNRALVGREP